MFEMQTCWKLETRFLQVRRQLYFPDQEYKDNDSLWVKVGQVLASLKDEELPNFEAP